MALPVRVTPSVARYPVPHLAAAGAGPETELAVGGQRLFARFLYAEPGHGANALVRQMPQHGNGVVAR